jgi:asparagine synthase (glutamine-hydrolysing)
MCGIAGISQRQGVLPECLRRMAEALKHRGPDDEGYLFANLEHGRYDLVGGEDTPSEVFSSRYPYTPQGTVFDLSSAGRYDLGLASRRLAIIDLSPAGHQPMCNEDGTLWIVHNGEIYNFVDLRRELEEKGHRFVSNTDTEVILHAYEEWGPSCLSKFNGMWAFCIWDSKARKLFCARDRFGIKPFYYYCDADKFMFASEIKALLAAGLPRRVNDWIVYEYLTKGLLDHTEETFFEGVKQLRGGEYLEFDLSTRSLSKHRYWDAPVEIMVGKRTDEDYASHLYELLEDAVRLRLVSDVPLGTCLSGGIDSSTIVCLVDRLMREKGIKLPGSDIQKTFSARYEDKRHDEGRFIDAVVQQTGVDARTTWPTAAELLKELDWLIYHQDEPFPNTSMYAQWCVFKLAKASGVTVTLDGQGADELLAGYDGFRIVYLAHLLKSPHWLRFLREAQSFANDRYDGSLGKVLYATVAFLLPQKIRKTMSQVKHLGMTSNSWLSSQFLRQFQDTGITKYPRDPRLAFVQTLTQTSLPALLRYEDRNSMAHSVEARLPFLDYRVVEFLLSLPVDQKIRHGLSKWVLRNAVKGLIPEEVRQRRDKIGFSTPEDIWLRKDLREFAETIISSDSFRSRKYFNPADVQQLFRLHLEGKQNLSGLIWQILILELWFRRFID